MLAGFEAGDHVLLGEPHVIGGLRLAYVPRRDTNGGDADVPVDQPRLGAKLHASERGLGLRHDEAGPRIASQMTGLDVLHREPQVEPTVPPLVPDRRELDRTVSAQGREHRDQR